jgi:preprotein translocase subunit SecD
MTRSLQWRIATVAVVLLVCLFLLYPSLGPVPAFWSKYLPNNPIRLGLDLQGGLYLILEVEADKAIEALTDQMIAETSALMKDARVRYNDVVRTSDTTFSVYLKDADQSSLFDDKVLDSFTISRRSALAPRTKDSRSSSSLIRSPLKVSSNVQSDRRWTLFETE